MIDHHDDGLFKAVREGYIAWWAPGLLALLLLAPLWVIGLIVAVLS